MEIAHQGATGSGAAGGATQNETGVKAPGPRKREKMDTILKMHAQGKSMEEIRQAVELSNATFHSYITELKLSAQRKKANRAQQLEDIKGLHEQGMPLEEICAVLGINPSRFVFFLKLVGIDSDDFPLRWQIREEVSRLKEGSFDLMGMADRLDVSVPELLRLMKEMSLTAK